MRPVSPDPPSGERGASSPVAPGWEPGTGRRAVVQRAWTSLSRTRVRRRLAAVGRGAWRSRWPDARTPRPVEEVRAGGAGASRAVDDGDRGASTPGRADRRRLHRSGSATAIRRGRAGGSGGRAAQPGQAEPSPPAGAARRRRRPGDALPPVDDRPRRPPPPPPVGRLHRRRRRSHPHVHLLRRRRALLRLRLDRGRRGARHGAGDHLRALRARTAWPASCWPSRSRPASPSAAPLGGRTLVDGAVSG